MLSFKIILNADLKYSIVYKVENSALDCNQTRVEDDGWAKPKFCINLKISISPRNLFKIQCAGKWGNGQNWDAN